MTNVKSMSISCILTIALITFMTIYGEVNLSFKSFLGDLFFHHWIAKGVISFIFFIAAYFSFNKFPDKSSDKFVNLATISAVLGFLVIFGFDIYEFFI